MISDIRMSQKVEQHADQILPAIERKSSSKDHISTTSSDSLPRKHSSWRARAKMLLKTGSEKEINSVQPQLAASIPPHDQPPVIPADASSLEATQISRAHEMSPTLLVSPPPESEAQPAAETKPVIPTALRDSLEIAEIAYTRAQHQHVASSIPTSAAHTLSVESPSFGRSPSPVPYNPTSDLNVTAPPPVTSPLSSPAARSRSQSLAVLSPPADARSPLTPLTFTSFTSALTSPLVTSGTSVSPGSPETDSIQQQLHSMPTVEVGAPTLATENVSVQLSPELSPASPSESRKTPRSLHRRSTEQSLTSVVMRAELEELDVDLQV